MGSSLEDKTVKAIVAMCLVAGLEAFAIYRGINGIVLTAAVATLAGLGGYAIGKKSD